MVKAKDLKLLRKKLAKADRIQDPLELIRVTMGLSSSAPVMGFASSTSSSTSSDSSSTCQYMLDYAASAQLSEQEKADELALFERNMGDLYRQSSWGLDLQEKADELAHHRARHLLVRAKEPQAPHEKNTTNDSSSPPLVAFVHFRFSYDDEDDPTAVVLYVYEIQIESAVQRRGLGKRLMRVLERLAATVSLDTVMLTVFQTNTAAMQFYTQAAGYSIDPNSPSQFGERADYEILSKKIDPDALEYE